MEPYVTRPSIFDEIFILVLISPDIASNVLGDKGDVSVIIEALSSSDGVIKHHYASNSVMSTRFMPKPPQ